MKKKREAPTVQIWDGKWYIDKFESHECCDCGLVHKTEYRVENGKIFTAWTTDRRATNKIRKAQGITVTRVSKTPES